MPSRPHEVLIVRLPDATHSPSLFLLMRAVYGSSMAL